MLIVTGATGHLGGTVVYELLNRVPATQVGVSVRNPTKAAGFVAKGVRVRHGDFDAPDSLLHAFEGATQVLIISSNAEATGGDAVGQHRTAIVAAKAAGARRILYTSHMAAAVDSKFLPIQTHVATEAMLRECGVPFTALRNGFYASSTAAMMGEVARSHAVVAPLDGKVSWTAHADLAAAAAAILADEGCFDGPTPPLTAQEALNLSDLTAIVGGVLGIPIERHVAPDDEFFGQAVAHGMSQAAAGIMRGFYQAARDGEFAATDPTLTRLIGRLPVSMRDVLAEKLAADQLSI